MEWGLQNKFVPILFVYLTLLVLINCSLSLEQIRQLQMKLFWFDAILVVKLLMINETLVSGVAFVLNIREVDILMFKATAFLQNHIKS